MYFIAEAEPRFFLGEKGKLECDGGVPVKDKATCEKGCAELGLALKGGLSDGFLCFRNGKRRNGKSIGQCNQNGNNGNLASLVCEKQSKYILRHFKINLIQANNIVIIINSDINTSLTVTRDICCSNNKKTAKSINNR